MLKDCMTIFEQMYREKGEKLILDNYALKLGTYRTILIDDDGFAIKDTLEIKKSKKGEVAVNPEMELLNEVKYYDYHSKLLEMNKPIDPAKAIHSNNYLSFAFKKSSQQEGKLKEDVIRRYYEILRDPLLKYKKGKTAQLYADFEKEYGAPDGKLIERIRDYILSGEGWKDIDFSKKDYMKIFFVFPDAEKTRELYKAEGERYLMPNIFNSNDYNQLVEEELLGLPNNNLGMNSKKPFLENKTRKVSIPHLLNQEKALLQNKFFDFLYGNAVEGRKNVYLWMEENRDGSQEGKIQFFSDIDKPSGFSDGYYLRIEVGQSGAEIITQEAVSNYSTNLKKAFVLKECMGLSKAEREGDEKKTWHNYNQSIGDLWTIKNVIDLTYFEGILSRNFFTEPKDINTKDYSTKRAILEARNALHQWFYGGKTQGVANVLDRVAFSQIVAALERGNFFKARDRFNMKCSLTDYFNENERMVKLMCEVREKLKLHLLQEEDWDFEDEIEYSYAIGQMAYYLVSLSKASNKTAALVNPFLNNKKIGYIKTRLLQLYKKYDHALMLSNKSAASKLLSHILTADDTKLTVDKYFILAGITAKSLLYGDKEKDKQEENENEGGRENENE